MLGSTKNSKQGGPHYLIKLGIKLIENIGDIIKEPLPKLDESFLDQVKNATSELAQVAQALTKQGTEGLDLITESPILIDEVLA